MSLFIKAAVWGGIAVVVITGSITGGMIANVINEGDKHKEKMTTSPPPPSPPPARRRLNEHEEIYGQRGGQFDLNKEERNIFTALAARQAATVMKR